MGPTPYDRESLLSDPLHGYIAFTAARGGEPATGRVRALPEIEAVARLPVSFSLCRLYARDHAHDAELAIALDRLLQARGDDKTNM
jgi:hypothetical protein